MSELRKDPILDRWVIIAPERQTKIVHSVDKEKKENKSEFCPFCHIDENNGHAIYQLTVNDTWQTKVIPNNYPALRVEGNVNREGLGIYDKMSGIGAHEVIIESHDHAEDIVDFSPEHIKNVFITFKKRILDLRNDHRLKYVLIYKNKGPRAGAPISHSHSQLVATPVIPKRVMEELKGAQKYYEFKERCIYCDIIRQEVNENSRLIQEEEYFVSIIPFAARFPFETWILPKTHISNFELSSDNLLQHLSYLFQVTIKKLNTALNFPDYSMIIHTSPLKDMNNDFFHWHIEIIPKIQPTTGFEWGTGFYINPTPPEEAAEFLRKINI